MKTQCFIFLLLFSSKLLASSIWEGDYHIESQEGANLFTQHCNCTAIDGNLIINGENIVQIDSLYLLEEVTGNIEIVEIEI